MAKDRTEDESKAHNAAEFVTTHWSVVLAAGDSASPDSQEALEKLCRQYWYPVYAFVRRQGYSPEDAKDLTQGFFEKLLEKKFLHSVAREKGSFRSFLVVAVKHFLANARDHLNAVKRGGRVQIISLDEVVAERRYSVEPSLDEHPERAFDRAWARGVVDQALERLEERTRQSGRSEEFEGLVGFLSAPPEPHEYKKVADTLSMSPEAVSMAVLRLRRAYRECVRSEVAQTVATPAEIDGELAYIIELLTQ